LCSRAAVHGDTGKQASAGPLTGTGSSNSLAVATAPCIGRYVRGFATSTVGSIPAKHVDDGTGAEVNAPRSVELTQRSAESHMGYGPSDSGSAHSAARNWTHRRGNRPTGPGIGHADDADTGDGSRPRGPGRIFGDRQAGKRTFLRQIRLQGGQRGG